jgi:hypothetical protein
MKKIPHLPKIVLPVLALLYPGNTLFVIFWFPIIIPLFVNLIASTTELAVNISGNKGQPLESAILSQEFLVVILKNSHLAFISTDLWALTTTLMESAKARLDGFKSFVYGCAAIIALFLHLLFYVLTVLSSVKSGDVWISCVLFIIGSISVMWLRAVILQAIEIKDLMELKKR